MKFAFIALIFLNLFFLNVRAETPHIDREPAAIPKNSKVPWNLWVPSSYLPEGLEFSFVYKGELSRVVSGGVESQNSYLEDLDMKLAIDAEKLMNWTGASFTPARPFTSAAC